MSLQDVSQEYGEDIQLSNTGDLALVGGNDRGQQRLVRRYLTNPGGYLFHPLYGGGVLADIGSTQDPNKIGATLRAQTLLEDSVAPTPAPVVTVNPQPTGELDVTVQYTDSPSNAPTVLAFNIEN